ncbi:MAG: type II secretion system F family protein [Anaerolineae bacterium]|nr:type II secretion system F family protein [Anaerolineae bacterium]
MAIIIIVVLLAAAILIFLGIRQSRQPDALEERLEQFGTLERPPSLEEIEMSQPFTERILLPVLRAIAQFVSRFTPRQSMESVQHQLDLAGNPYSWGPMEYLGVRGVVFVLFAAIAGLIFFAGSLKGSQKFLVTGLAFVAGIVMPVLWLKTKISRRQRSIIKSLPDALDLLTICVEAGLGFDAAMSKVAEKWEDELSVAFMRVIHEIQLGKLRREALRDMADRMEVTDVSTFIAAIIQADQLGVSIARVLRIQSDQMRVRRRQRAEEQARAATLKILPPVVFLIFPSILVVLLGPAIITFKNMQGVFGF